MNFAQTIKAYRTRNRLTLSQFSELSGVERATINRLERGLGNPRPMTVYLLTQAMKLTPSEIVFGSTRFSEEINNMEFVDMIDAISAYLHDEERN